MHNNPAYQQLTATLLEDLLQQVGKKNQFPLCGAGISRTDRSKIAVMVECPLGLDDTPRSQQNRILATVPPRRAESVTLERIEPLVSLLNTSDEIQIWDPDMPGVHVEPLKEIRTGVSMAIPLIAGGVRAGGVLLFDLPQIDRIEEVMMVFRTISPVVALALRSALLLDYQETKLEEQSKSLQEYRNSLQAFFDNRIVGMVQLDKTGKYTQVNRRWTEMTGYSQQEAMHLTYGDITHPEDLTEETLMRLARGEISSFERQQRYIHKSGKMFWAFIAGNAIYNHEGGFGGLVLLITDITMHKEEEQKRIELEEQIRQKYKMEAVGVMAGGIAHNFNNNLAIILGNLEMLELKKSQPEGIKYLKNAKTAALRARDLVAQIMTYSHKSDKPSSMFKPDMVVEETLNLLHSTLPATINLQYENHLDSDNENIEADPGQIQEALLNICNNAVHAMDEEGKLNIELSQVDVTQDTIPDMYECRAGRYIRLEISDTGSGMDNALRERIFDPFFTTKEVGKGTGMGLATVQGIVIQHQGFIQVRSSPGKGTTFSLYFPVVDAGAGINRSEQETELNCGKGYILYVDDDPVVADLGQMMLEELGYQVEVYTDSREALELFRANPAQFDMVITDQTMPDLTGDRLIAELKQIRPDISTILCTGYSSKVSSESAAEMGINAFMMKPISLQELSRAVSNVLQKRPE